MAKAVYKVLNMYYVTGFDTTIVKVAMLYWSWDFIHLIMIKKGDTFSTGLKSASISIWFFKTQNPHKPFLF